MTLEQSNKQLTTQSGADYELFFDAGVRYSLSREDLHIGYASLSRNSPSLLTQTGIVFRFHSEKTSAELTNDISTQSPLSRQIINMRNVEQLMQAFLGCTRLLPTPSTAWSIGGGQYVLGSIC
jgi:hypothetical protein